MDYIAYKYKLKPTKEQENILRSCAGGCRWLWNHMLEENIRKHKEEKKFVFKHEMIVSLPKLKQEYEWLKEMPAQSLQQRLMDLDTAIRRCFKSGFGFPKFKSKNNQSDTFRIPNSPEQIHTNNKSIKIPKIGWMKWIRHRPHTGKLKSITIKQEGNDWFVICLCETQYANLISEVNTSDICGIDLGLESFCVLSDGTNIENERFLYKKQQTLKRRQRKLSRLDVKNNKKPTNRRKIAKQKLTKIHKDIKNTRNDFLHKVSTSIAKKWNVVGIEDLNVKGMIQNRRLAKSISDVGWSSFRNMLKYKMEQKGGYLMLIDRFYPSTKTCSSCGQIKDMELNERTYICECGLEMSRDLNAAINIKCEAINELHRHGTYRINGQGDTSGGGVAYDTSSHVSMNCQKFRNNFSEAISL